jgi:hypothetical protein
VIPSWGSNNRPGIGISSLRSAGPLLAAFDSVTIEDDSSAEWAYTIDLIEILSASPAG